MSGLRDFAASVNHIQMDRFLRGQAPLGIDQLKQIRTATNRKERTLGQVTSELVTYERILTGLSYLGQDFPAQVRRIDESGMRCQINSFPIGPVSLVLTNGFAPSLKKGDLISLRLDGYDHRARRFNFKLTALENSTFRSA